MKNKDGVEDIWRIGKVFDWNAFNGCPEKLAEKASRDGINCLQIMDRYFTRGDQSNAELISVARRQGIRIIIIFQCFYNDEFPVKRGEAACGLSGRPLKEDWLSFRCPNDEAYKERRLADITDLAGRLRPDGISLDFFRYFVFWESGREDSLKDSCFCPRCISRFNEEQNVENTPEEILENYAEQWVRFKCGVIADYARRIRAAVKAVSENTLTAIHLVPWGKDEYESARRRIAAQDLSVLSDSFDLYQPMTYSKILSRDIKWIIDTGRGVKAEVPAGTVVPCIQAETAKPGAIRIIEEAVSAPGGFDGYAIWPYENY